MSDSERPSAPAAAATAASADTGALAPLRGPVFRTLWLTWLAANLCLWMNDVAAAWLMTSLSSSPAMVALVQSASTLPTFLLGLPSGAFADILDRRRYFMWTQFWVAGVAVVACAILLAGAMTAPMLLLLTFLNGVGLAMRWPVFAALIPELVPRPQLPAALALNGIAMNVSRIAGPLVAGLILASLGAVWVYVLNALLSVVAGVAILRWKREATPSALPGERFLGAMRVGLQHVGQSARMHAVLLRVALFFLQSSALIALLPLVARRLHGPGGAGTFTLLLALLGAGAIIAALQLPRLRRHWNRDQLVDRCILLHAAATTTVALTGNLWIAAPAMMAAGAALITAANSLTISAQLALPDWVRARGMSIYQMALMGGSAAGAALWGQVASFTETSTALIAASACGVVAAAFVRHRRVEGPSEDDLSPYRDWSRQPEPAEPIDPEAGPVLVTIEYRVDPQQAAAFRAVMEDSRRSRLRQGVLAWELFHDVVDPSSYIEYFIDETWVEHLRRHDRATAADADLRERRLAFHTGDAPPLVRRWIAGRAVPRRTP